MTAIVLKATVVLAAAWCGTALLRSRSAALRHVIWTAALAIVLLLPLSGTLAPAWTPVAASIPSFAPATLVVSAVAGTVPAAPIRWLPILYGIGALLAACRFLAGALRVSWISRHASPHPLGAEYGIRVL